MKNSTDIINELFEDTVPPLGAEGLPAILVSTPTSEASKEAEKQALPSLASNAGLDRREFTRIDVAQKHLEFKFTNEMHFAYQYIENISIGGLFIKTAYKPAMGSIVPIEFSIPKINGELRTFSLKAKVCRVAETGVGLQFTNLEGELRQEFESYVRSILPDGTSMTTQVKQSTVERLEKMRERSAEKSRKNALLFRNSLVIAALIALNVFLFYRVVQEDQMEQTGGANSQIEIGEHALKAEDIRSVQKNNDNSYTVFTDASAFTVSEASMSGPLPYHLQQTVNLLNSIPPPAPKHISKTAEKLVRLR